MTLDCSLPAPRALGRMSLAQAVLNSKEKGEGGVPKVIKKKWLSVSLCQAWESEISRTTVKTKRDAYFKSVCLVNAQ